ncbi:MAG: hypothetical protein AAF937_04230 [Planctomycetota bacterium]
MQRPIHAVLVVPLLLAACSCARGQADESDPAPLAGPEVRQTRPERMEQGLTSDRSTGMQMGQVRQLPPKDLREILDAMSKEDTPDAVRMTAAQRAAIRAITRDHHAAVRAHRAEHADTLNALRVRGGVLPERIAYDKLSQDQRAARSELQALLRTGPSTADLQARVFAELTGPQREHADAAIDTLLERRAREAREKRYADELNAAPVDTAAFFRQDGTVNMEALPERLRRQLADVKEPRRAQRLRRLLDRFAERRAQPSEPTPDGPAAPDLESVPTPTPDPQ